MFQPIIIAPGLAGWEFLKATYDRQFQTFTQSAELRRDTEYFKENISNVTTAEELVSDRRLLNVALGAFGLSDDINNRFFIQKMLEEGTTANDALANRFTDQRYRDFSAAFGLGPGEIPGSLTSGFADRIAEQYEAQRFEIATGDIDESFRIALFAERKLGDIASGDGSENQKWFEIMGNPPLRNLFETAFGLPTEFSQIDLDQQLGILQDRAADTFGSSDPSQFGEAERVDQLIDRFIARSQLEGLTAGLSSGSIALTLLQNG